MKFEQGKLYQVLDLDEGGEGRVWAWPEHGDGGWVRIDAGQIFMYLGGKKVQARELPFSDTPFHMYDSILVGDKVLYLHPDTNGDKDEVKRVGQ